MKRTCCWSLTVVLVVSLFTIAVQGSSAKELEKDGVEIQRLVRIDTAWREAEVFVIEPGKKIELRVDCPQAAGAAVVSKLVPKAEMARVLGLSTSDVYRWTIPYGTAVQLDENRLEWVTPAGPGHYKIDCLVNVRRSLSYRTAEGSEKHRELEPLIAQTTFHILVPHEFNPEGPGVIEGYPIGVYPSEKGPNVKAVVAAHRNRYRPPKWFVAVTPETADLRVSKRFRLREFVPNAPRDATVYFPFNLQLCEALEAIRAELETKGLKEPRVRILRGYVSPHEASLMQRKGIKMLTWNRYQYGDAVMIIVDRNLDDVMDDINADGKTDGGDAQIVASVVRQVQDRLGTPGWIGVYAKRPDKTLPYTPIVGFDLRGWRVETTYGGGE